MPAGGFRRASLYLENISIKQDYQIQEKAIRTP